LCIAFSGCNTYAKWRFGMQTKHMPDTRLSYLKKVNKKKFFSDSCFYSLPAKKMESFFRKEIIPDSQYVFLGYYISDSSKVSTSPFLMLNQSCKGRLEKEVEQILSKGYEASQIQKENSLLSYNLERVVDKQNLNPSIFDNPVLIFLCTYRTGTYYYDMWKYMKKSMDQSNKKVSVLVICIDPVFKLK
jgi:hypothetical protein